MDWLAAGHRLVCERGALNTDRLATADSIDAVPTAGVLEPLPGDLYGYEQLLTEQDQQVLPCRFFNDAEALYSYEGTRELNTSIVGRHIPGRDAFV